MQVEGTSTSTLLIISDWFLSSFPPPHDRRFVCVWWFLWKSCIIFSKLIFWGRIQLSFLSGWYTSIKGTVFLYKGSQYVELASFVSFRGQKYLLYILCFYAQSMMTIWILKIYHPSIIIKSWLTTTTKVVGPLNSTPWWPPDIRIPQNYLTN